MTVSEILKAAADVLQSSGIIEAGREAKSLLAFALSRNQTFLVAHPEYELSDAEKTRFQTVLERRARREPFQYIVGKQEFYGLDFAITKDVLIPRPETELIVENAIEILRKSENAKFCEVGIGSGCISISVLYHIKSASAIGLDISEKALTAARKNAEIHRVAERLKLKISDVFHNLSDEKFDLIVSNPPYISNDEIQTLQPEVRDYEPLTALTDGVNGLSIIGKIIADAPKFLTDGGYILMEIGFNQAISVEEMFNKSVWRKVEFLPDLQGIPRTVKAGKK
jgi:release factor glutamine methyltransferase